TCALPIPLPDGLIIPLPKITSVEHVEAMVWLTEQLERRFDLPEGRLGFELQIETPQSIMLNDGTAAVAPMIRAGAGRVTALHYGTYDYSASVGVPAAYQSLAHPVADHAKAVMQVAAAGTGVWLSDGGSNVMPTGTTAEVRSAWGLHAGLVRRSLERGYLQGWDLHPHQLVTRHLATCVFYREAFAPAAERLRAYLGQVSATSSTSPPPPRHWPPCSSPAWVVVPWRRPRSPWPPAPTPTHWCPWPTAAWASRPSPRHRAVSRPRPHRGRRRAPRSQGGAHTPR